MKLNLKSIFSAGVILPLFFVGTVWAQPTRTDTSKNEKLLKRLEERKNNMQTRLTDFQQQQVKLSCKAAQGKIKVVQGRLNGKAAERATKLNTALENLNRLSSKLKEREIDTPALDAQITEYKTMVDNYTTSFNDFRLLIDDLVAMDCESDPEGFKASLLEAREKRTLIVQSANDAKNFLATKIKPTLLAARESVSKASSNTEPGGEN